VTLSFFSNFSYSRFVVEWYELFQFAWLDRGVVNFL